MYSGNHEWISVVVTVTDSLLSQEERNVSSILSFVVWIELASHAQGCTMISRASSLHVPSLFMTAQWPKLVPSQWRKNICLTVLRQIPVLWLRIHGTLRATEINSELGESSQNEVNLVRPSDKNGKKEIRSWVMLNEIQDQSHGNIYLWSFQSGK